MPSPAFDKLNDENYPAWSKYMQALLVKQDLWSIVSGDTPRLTGSPMHKAVVGWQRKHDTAAAEILLNVSTKFIGHCDNSDAPGTWNKLRMMFQSKGHSTVAALCHQFHSMSYKPHLSMCTWITNVEDLAHCLESSNSPMIPIDIINTMICQLPDSYSLLIVHFDTMLQDPNASSDLNTVQYVIM